MQHSRRITCTAFRTLLALPLTMGLCGQRAAVAQAVKPVPSPPALAVAEPPKPAPYDAKLSRLAEILGSIHYLRNLCDPTQAGDWRAPMSELLDSDTANEPARREILTAAFNRGYRSFASVYTTCTPAAIVAEERYRAEGATLAGEITARFGN